MSVYDRLFPPRQYRLPSGETVEEKRSRMPFILLVILLITALSVHITGFNFGNI